MTTVFGISGAREHAAACLTAGGRVLAFCEQERVTRLRGAGFLPASLPHQAIEAAWAAAERRPTAVERYATTEPGTLPGDVTAVYMDHHQAHAAATAVLSGFDRAAVLVCDRAPDSTTVWRFDGGRLERVTWRSFAQGFADVFARAAALLGFPPGREHELEALARLDRGHESERFTTTIGYADGHLRVSPGWEAVLGDLLGGRGTTDLDVRAGAASALQSHLATLLVRLAADVRRDTGLPRLCVGGGLFYNTSFTTALRQAGLFDEVYVLPNPGNASTAIGAALLASHDGQPGPAAPVSPFLGPAYDAEFIKRTLDNCKLAYEYLGDGEVVDVAAGALARGQLVGWFQGRMEWGHRALGHRSILASPFAPHVLENLNLYLKHRAPYRAYGVSVPLGDVSAHFDGPPASPHMEYEFSPRDRDRFASILPGSTRSLRVQTVAPIDADAATTRFHRLHQAFGARVGVPVLVNTSFNGFSEPMVCTPRDAVRVFYGTGLDLLVIDRFVIRK